MSWEQSNVNHTFHACIVRVKSVSSLSSRGKSLSENSNVVVSTYEKRCCLYLVRRDDVLVARNEIICFMNKLYYVAHSTILTSTTSHDNTWEIWIMRLRMSRAL